jgi:molybdopterin-guanine dinucleotide biosynthesis protein A
MDSKEKYFVNGYILAGGKSSRMGMDKGLMLLNGKAVVQYVIDALKPVMNRIVIVSNNHEYQKFGLEVIEDLIKDIGPAGGIYTALNHSDSQRNFIVSCDMPFVSSEAIKFLIEGSTPSEITLPIHNQILEPLFGVYSKTCLFKWNELIERRIIKLQDLAEQFIMLKLNVDGNENFNELLFTNINTKKDFENAIQQI